MHSSYLPVTVCWQLHSCSAFPNENSAASQQHESSQGLSSVPEQFLLSSEAADYSLFPVL